MIYSYITYKHCVFSMHVFFVEYIQTTQCGNHYQIGSISIVLESYRRVTLFYVHDYLSDHNLALLTIMFDYNANMEKLLLYKSVFPWIMSYPSTSLLILVLLI